MTEQTQEQPGICSTCGDYCDDYATICGDCLDLWGEPEEAQRWLEKAANHLQAHAEVTPAGLNYLLPGVEPIHTTTQGEGQARLL